MDVDVEKIRELIGEARRELCSTAPLTDDDFRWRADTALVDALDLLPRAEDWADRAARRIVTVFHPVTLNHCHFDSKGAPANIADIIREEAAKDGLHIGGGGTPNGKGATPESRKGAGSDVQIDLPRGSDEEWVKAGSAAIDNAIREERARIVGEIRGVMNDIAADKRLGRGELSGYNEAINIVNGGGGE